MKLTPPFGDAARLAAVALLYALLGTAGLALAVPPSNASPVFPAAGFALATVLARGNRMLAAVWLGSLAMHILAPPYLAHISLAGTLIAAANGLGAALEAWAGAALVRRALPDNWQRLAHERDAIRFLVLAGPVACLVSPSISMPALYLAGFISPHDLFHAWWTWYVGDSLGVLLFAPLSLFFLYRKDPLWAGRIRSILLPMLAVLAAAVAAFYGAARVEDRDVRAQIASQGAALSGQLQARARNVEAILSALARFMEVVPEAGYGQFLRFTEGALNDNPDIQALSFDPELRHAERAAFEAAMAKRLPSGRYGITERNSASGLVAAGEHPAYVAVAYIAPLSGNEKAVGFDILSEPSRRDAIRRARDSGRMALTTALDLVQGGREHRPGVLALYPARRIGAGTGQAPLGYAVAVLHTDTLIDAATRDLPLDGLAFTLEDSGAPSGRTLVYRTTVGEGRQEYQWRGTLPIGDRRWALTVAPTARYLRDHRPWGAWTLGVGGLLFATLLQVLMLGVTARAALIRLKVAEQTGEILAKSRALEESEERYRRLFHDSRMPMLLLDPADGTIVDANQSAAGFYGYSRQQMRGMPIRDINQLPPERIRKAIEEFSRENRQVLEFPHRLASGDIRQVEVRSGPVLIGGRPLLFSVIQDITERKRLEAELQAYQGRLEQLVAERTAQLSASEAHTRLILESTGDGLFGLDTEGRIGFINPAASRILGYPAEEAIGRDAHALFHHSRANGSPYPAADCPVLRALRAGSTVTVGDESYWHAQGHAVPVIYSAHPMVRDGAIVGSVVSFVDITERRAVEEAREAARREAERLARVKSEFLANMSHEIRTPLNGVLGMAQIGYRRSPEGREYFGRILESGQLLLGIINDILDFSKIEAGKLTIEQLPFDPHALMARASAMLAERARAKGLEFSVQTTDDFPATCQGDPLRIEQVLVNLLSNAVKFTERGSVTLHAGREDGMLVFRVRDTGIGMNGEQMEKAFAPFEQADGSTTRKFGGTGLGLTISRRLAELMGGHIRVESRPGEGSTFELSVPAGAPATLPARGEDDADRPPSALRLAGIRVLAAEDNPINRIVLDDILQGEGATATLVDDGLAAVERIRAGGRDAYDVVLMDIQMPGLDGQEAARRILELAPGLPIIAQTAHALAEEKARSSAAGMVDHVAKPLEIEELVAAILKHAHPSRGA